MAQNSLKISNLFLITTFFVFLLYHELSLTERTYKITKPYCESFNKSWFVFKECRVKAIRRGISEVNITGTVLHPANVIHVQFEMVKRFNGYKPFLINATIDACDYFRRRNHPFANLVYKLLRDFSNLNHSCPYYGEVMVKRFYLRRNLYTLPLPNGEYGLTLTWFFHHMLTEKTFRITKPYCESFNKSWFVYKECRVKAIKRGITEVNFSGTILHPASIIQIRLEVVKRFNGYKPFLVNTTIDACAYLRKPNNPIVQVIYGMFKDFSNINHTCPYYGEVMVKRFYLRRSLLNLPLPNGEYGLTLTWIFHHMETFVTTVYFEFSDS